MSSAYSRSIAQMGGLPRFGSSWVPDVRNRRGGGKQRGSRLASFRTLDHHRRRVELRATCTNVLQLECVVTRVSRLAASPRDPDRTVCLTVCRVARATGKRGTRK